MQISVVPDLPDEIMTCKYCGKQASTKIIDYIHTYIHMYYIHTYVLHIYDFMRTYHTHICMLHTLQYMLHNYANLSPIVFILNKHFHIR